MTKITEAIISIHPEHAEAILVGTKTIEVRRRIPSISCGAKLWIYATRPTAAVVGTVTITRVVHANPRIIWQLHRNGIGVTHHAFKKYLDGSREAVAIILAAAKRVGPITIDQLRSIREQFHPPQVMTVLTSSEVKMLRKLTQ